MEPAISLVTRARRFVVSCWWVVRLSSWVAEAGGHIAEVSRLVAGISGGWWVPVAKVWHLIVCTKDVLKQLPKFFETLLFSTAFLLKQQ